MELVCLLILSSGLYPLWRAWRANQRTSLSHAVLWAFAAWMGWLALFVALVGDLGQATGTLRYLALCLTACASMAVLGARRPGVGAWNFALVGLLLVMLLPLAENWLAGGALPAGLRLVFLGGTLAVGVLNYLPTRLAPPALLLAVGCAGEMTVWADAASADGAVLRGTRLALVFVPWAALWTMRAAKREVSQFDRLWLEFRDRYGLLWGQRVREQFNRSAAHAGWPVLLRWRGLRWSGEKAPPEAAAPFDLLRSLLKRFDSG